MGFVKEFRDFALKGNVFDMAIGVIIGGAFGKIVGSLIDHVLNPVIGKAAGKVDFTAWYMPLTTEKLPDTVKTYEDARKLMPIVGYGAFLTEVINFIILAFVVFIMVKVFNSAKSRFDEKKAPAAPPGPTPEQRLLTEIRDLLKRH